jgi:hypothetical protein
VSHGGILVGEPLIEDVSPTTTDQKARVLDKIYPDYPREPPPEKIHCLNLGGRTNYWTEKFFPPLVISSKDPKVYEWWGMGTKKPGTLSEQWQEMTLTII